MKPEFDYKDIDREGLEVLEVIAAADKFNQWMYQTIAPFCTGNILEIGSGTGNISQFFIRNKASIVLSDIRLNYRNILQEKFGLDDQSVLEIDIAHPDFEQVYPTLLGHFDSIFCLNVVEHIKNDHLAIQNMMKLLKQGGTLTVLVPAHQALYNGFDVTLEHFRRYNRKSLTALMSKHGRLTTAFYFNAMGIPAWFISGNLLKRRSIPKGQMKLFNYLVPVFVLIDKITFRKIGLSVICVAEKMP